MKAHRIPGQIQRRLYGKVEWRSDNRYDAGLGSALTSDLREAELVSSEIAGTALKPRHAPVFDLDIPARLVPSSTPGHSHLYLDVEMSWEQYAKLLTALADAKIIEPEYAQVSIERRRSEVRVPWLRKPPSGGALTAAS